MRLGRALIPIAAAAMAAVGLATSDRAGAQEAGQDRFVRACTPELVHGFQAKREMDAAALGTGLAPNLRYTDADGSPRNRSTATVEWSARALVDYPERETGVGPDIGGHLDVAIGTAAGERLRFTATCIAAAGGFSLGMVVYANGIVRGWPGSGARRALVHFEAYKDGSAYVALVDGSDCNLNFGALVVTDDPYVTGTATFSGLPPRFVYAETECARRFGDPFPASRAPGRIEP